MAKSSPFTDAAVREAFNADFQRALAFATRLHADQLRNGSNIPYIAHPLAVASLVLENGGGRDEAIAALLHDSIEDCSDRYTGGAEELRAYMGREFGSAVAAIVDACTDAHVTPKPPWRQRKEEYLRHLATATPGARLVSCADKLHNARAIVADLRADGGGVFRRFKAGREGTLWYYQSLANEFEEGGPALMAAELRRTVDEMLILARDASDERRSS